VVDELKVVLLGVTQHSALDGVLHSIHSPCMSMCKGEADRKVRTAALRAGWLNNLVAKGDKFAGASAIPSSKMRALLSP
jgi:hypothetical protein